ncbi:carbohydrate-binding protein [Flavobacterium sp. RHBU_3]|uniref:carbohydrate-binding protein n=1 Tax=Flavobacterium sp. RHBU_3 TaxID=3391184 RepID=UPI003985009B
MKKILLLITLLAGTAGFSQGYLHQQGQNIVDGDGNNVVLRGLGLGGWMIQEGYMLQTSNFAGTQHEIRQKITDVVGEANAETFYQKYRDNGITKRDIDSLKAWGFNSVRLPMHYNLYTLPIEQEPVSGQQTWLDEGFERTDQLLQWCADNQMYLILDMHAAPGGQGKDANISDYDPSKPSLWESEANKQKMIALWHKLADRYKDSPWIGAYDLINEPNWNFTGTNQNGCDEGNNGPLRSLMMDITTSIRQVDTNHMIIIEGNCWGNNYNGIFPLWDTNMALSFHKYWNNNSTGSIQGMLNLRNQYNVPLWLGESGENGNVWFTDAIKLAETNNIGWSWWPMKKIESISGMTSVSKPAGYQQLLDYWNGNGSAPAADVAFASLMQLADNYKIENVTINYSVMDAMFRQVQTTDTKKYKNHPLPGKVYVTEYDFGTNGYAYKDNDVATYHSDGGTYQAWNQGWQMRNDGVDIETTTDSPSNGYQVGFIQPGEWMQYTLEVTADTAYDIDIRYAGNGGKLHFEDENGRISETITLSGTGGYTTWGTATLTDVILHAGTNKVKLYVDSTGFNLNYFELKNPSATTDAAFKIIDAGTNVLGDKIEVSFNKGLVSGIDYNQSALTLKINGAAVAISGFTQTGASSFSFIPATAINNGDVITLTYAGTNLIAADATTQQAFTDKAVTNRVGNVQAIPGTIQAESFYVNNGLSLETTTDTGGGQNIGYTNTGDYLDYLVNVEQTGNYKIEYRYAGNAAIGQIKLQLINAATLDVETVTLSVTGGWQTWQTKTSQAQMPAGRYYLRMLVMNPEFNLNWLRFTYMEPDDDMDGVPNTQDQCANTPAGSVVDFNGCPIFTLPQNNFTVTVASETCRSENNGSISIAALANHNYTATLTGTNNSASFTTSTAFTNLEAGNYQLCITLAEAPTYQQCYDVTIDQPDDLAVLSRMSGQNHKVTLDLYGGETYTINLNGDSFTTTQNTVELTLAPGENTVTVNTNKPCQGTYTEKFVLDASAVIYPNPVDGANVYIDTPYKADTNVTVEIFDTLGKKVYSNSYPSQKGSMAADVSKLSPGVYMVRVVSAGNVTNSKIVKQ